MCVYISMPSSLHLIFPCRQQKIVNFSLKILDVAIGLQTSLIKNVIDFHSTREAAVDHSLSKSG